MSWLHTAVHDGTEPGDALDLLAETAAAQTDASSVQGVGLVYGPRSYTVARFDGQRLDRQRLLGRDGVLDLASAFELRVTAAGIELRWVRGNPHQVRLQWVDETDAQHAVQVEVSEGQYLLWGTVARSEGGWATLREARIGELHVPVAAARHARLCWKTRRCLARIRSGEGAGNVYLAAELLGDIGELDNRERDRG